MYGPQDSPGLDGSGADFLCYDPYEKCFIRFDEAHMRGKAARVDVPKDHPVGWDINSFRMAM